MAAVDRASERVDLVRLAEVFGQIDFNSDLQPGDRFEVLFEKDSRDGEFSAYGSILAAALVNRGPPNLRRAAYPVETVFGGMTGCRTPAQINADRRPRRPAWRRPGRLDP